MKKAVTTLMIAGVIFFGIAGTAAALPFTETFLGDEFDNNYYEIFEGYKARFAFNLTSSGYNEASLYDTSSWNDLRPPTEDEKAFEPLIPPRDVTSAVLSFTISSEDVISKETVRIKAGIHDGNKKIYEGEFALGYWVWDVIPSWSNIFGKGHAEREYASIDLDLISLGLGDYLDDGKFISLVIAPDEYCLLENDFRIDQAKLTVSTPEPATMLLLGLGLIGIAGVRRFRKSR